MYRRTGSLSVLALLMSAGAQAQDATQFLRAISAGTIAAVSDGDFVAETYANGRLAPADADYRDVLTVLSLADGKVTASRIEVSNSVTAAPEIMQLTRDGRTAFVVERLAARTEGALTPRDLAPGKRLFAIDLSNKAAPRHAGATEVAAFPEAMAISPDGDRVAIVSNAPEESVLQIVRYGGGRFETEARVNLKDVGVTAGGVGPRDGITATNVQWHPSGKYLAVNLSSQNRIAFVDISNAQVRLWGNIVDVGRDPYVGRFTPDGRHYITSDWGRNLAETAVEARLPDTPSQVSVIRFSTDGGAASHTRIATAVSDLSAEGLAVSPDGKLIATVNMRTTAFPPTSSRFRREASVSLFSFDADSGAIEKLGDTSFEGVLPEGGVFDLTGDHFIATVFQGHEGARSGAGLEVFRVIRRDRPQLVRLGRVPLPHGVHAVDVSR